MHRSSLAESKIKSLKILEARKGSHSLVLSTDELEALSQLTWESLLKCYSAKNGLPGLFINCARLFPLYLKSFAVYWARKEIPELHVAWNSQEEYDMKADERGKDTSLLPEEAHHRSRTALFTSPPPILIMKFSFFPGLPLRTALRLPYLPRVSLFEVKLITTELRIACSLWETTL